MFLVRRLYSIFYPLKPNETNAEETAQFEDALDSERDSDREEEEDNLVTAGKASNGDLEEDPAPNPDVNLGDLSDLQFFDTATLRKLEDYAEASNSKGTLIMGRSKEKHPFMNNPEYIGRVLNPERRNDEWTSERNAAFWAGGIESSATFHIVSRMNSIVTRAEYGQEQGQNSEGYFGGTAPELLWLEDNGYKFVPDAKNYNCTYAVPPEKKISNAVLRANYGHSSDKDAHQQLARLRAIAKGVAAKRYAKPTPEGAGGWRGVSMFENARDELGSSATKLRKSAGGKRLP